MTRSSSARVPYIAYGLLCYAAFLVVSAYAVGFVGNYFALFGWEGEWFRSLDVGVKAPQFSFTRLEGADPVLGVEMASTGEVGCLGEDFEEAFLKALLSVGFRLPVSSVLLSTGPIADKAAFLESARTLCGMGVKLFATEGTAAFLKDHGVPALRLHWPTDVRSPNVLQYLQERRIGLVINIPKNSAEEELANDYVIRRKAAGGYSARAVTSSIF